MKKYRELAVEKNQVLGVSLSPPSVFLKDGRTMQTDRPSARKLIESYSDSTMQENSATGKDATIASDSL